MSHRLARALEAALATQERVVKFAQEVSISNESWHTAVELLTQILIDKTNDYIVEQGYLDRESINRTYPSEITRQWHELTNQKNDLLLSRLAGVVEVLQFITYNSDLFSQGVGAYLGTKLAPYQLDEAMEHLENDPLEEANEAFLLQYLSSADRAMQHFLLEEAAFVEKFLQADLAQALTLMQAYILIISELAQPSSDE